MGGVLKARALLCAAGVALSTVPAIAQTDDARVFTAGKVTELVVPSTAEAVLAVELCGAGEAATWKKIVERADQRYKMCVAQDPKWTALGSEYEKEEKAARASGSDKAIMAFAFDDYVRTRGAEARRDVADYCGRVPWKMVLDPPSAAASRAEFQKSHDKVAPESIDEFQTWFGWLRSLAGSDGWVTTKCEDFWPAIPSAGNTTNK
jgi:hypothetical protein